jgi:hypothetical protein
MHVGTENVAPVLELTDSPGEGVRDVVGATVRESNLRIHAEEPQEVLWRIADVLKRRPQLVHDGQHRLEARPWSTPEPRYLQFIRLHVDTEECWNSRMDIAAGTLNA